MLLLLGHQGPPATVTHGRRAPAARRDPTRAVIHVKHHLWRDERAVNRQKHWKQHEELREIPADDTNYHLWLEQRDYQLNLYHTKYKPWKLKFISAIFLIFV